MARTDDDTWDLASSVGATATMVAAGRAMATRDARRLIDDPFAEPLVRAVGIRFFVDMIDGRLDTSPFGDAGPARVQAMIAGMAMRTKFFDEYLTRAADSGVRQVVILASGLDSRAYRLPWPEGTVVFEIDQPKVLDYKTTTLRSHGVRPAADRREVAVDLRQDWPAALRAAGFDPAGPTAWLAEGLLMYLPSDAQDRLFGQITELSAPGSRVSAEAVRHHDEQRRAQMRQRWQKMADDIGIERTVDIQDLTYNDPERADVTEWLNAHGWAASGVSSADEMRRLDRWVEVPGQDEEYRNGFSTFVIAERLR